MKNYLTLFLISIFLCGTARADLIITGMYDGPLPGGLPKGIELYATDDVADLSIYALASVNNGGGIDTVEFTFPAGTVTAGEFLYIASDSTGFNDFFGFFPHFTTSAANINGDDAFLLFKNGAKHDIFGDENVDGNGEPWEYLDGWAYRKDGTGPDGSTFVLDNWTYSGPNALDGESTNASAASPVPLGTYQSGLPMVVVKATPSNTFVPADITIFLNETVHWENEGGFHNVNGTLLTFPNNPEPFTNGAPSSDAWTYSYTFTLPGNYQYQCDPHAGLGMMGSITVINAPPPAYDIATVTTTDADGVPDSTDVECELTGVVHGGNFAGGSSTSITFIDATGGINCFISGGNNPNGIVLAEGDEITVQGTIGAFNGVTQISPDTFWVSSSGNTLVTPAVVTALDEGTESELVRINGLTITDPSQWTGSGSGFNVTVTDGTNDYTMRIDNSVDLYSAAAPTGTFDAIGIGSQFDNSSPFITGYQFFPRYTADIIPVATPVTTANDDDYTTAINTDIEIDLLANDVTPDSVVSLTIIDMPTLGTLTPTTGTLFNYSPNMDICGMVEMFTYEICDSLSVCDTASVSINILCPTAYPAYDIATVTTVDTDGVPDSMDVTCELTGVIHGGNFAGGTSSSFTFIDATGGINCFIPGATNPNGIVLLEGDEITVQGTIGAFNGVTQISPDTFWVNSSGNALVMPAVVTALDESTESEMVRINGLTIPDPSQWTGSGSGFNVTVTDGTNNYTMRIDNSVDLYSAAAPTGDFDAIGIGSQFDNSAPHDQGYQFFPRYTADIIPIVPDNITAVDDIVVTMINVPVTINVLGNDGLPNGVDTVYIVDNPSLGTVGVNMDNTITYSPDVDVCGDDSFTYAICDAIGCDTASIAVTIECPVTYPLYDIAEVNTTNADGEADSLGVTCEVRGIVYGVNLRPAGLQFTLIDQNDADAGMGLFFNTGNFGYTVTEGDEIAVQGTVGFFNGLVQMNPDSVWMLSAGNALHDAPAVTALDESTESKLVKIENLTIVDPSQWDNSNPAGFNVTVTDGTNDYAMRIDNDVEMYNQPVPTQAFNLTGIGGQFDNESPYLEGYQLLPRYAADIDLINSTQDPTLENKIQVYPNPVSDLLEVRMDVSVERIQLINLLGQVILTNEQPEQSVQLDMTRMPQGLYLLTFYTKEGNWTKEIVRQ